MSLLLKQKKQVGWGWGLTSNEEPSSCCKALWHELTCQHLRSHHGLWFAKSKPFTHLPTNSVTSDGCI